MDGSHVGKNVDFLSNILKENRKADYGNDELIIISEYPDIKLPHKSDKAYVLSRIRNTDFPQISDMNGERIEALVLGEGKGLRDPAHFIVFENGAIIGAEANRQARDVATALQFILSTWVHDFGSKYGIKDVSINRIRRGRITPEMFTSIRSIKIQSSPNYMSEMMTPDDSIKSIFSSNNEVKVTLGIDCPKKRNDKRGLQRIGDVLGKLIREAEKAESTFSMLKIEGIRKTGNGKYETINVLDNIMVVKKTVVGLDNNTKGVLPESMYQSIIDVYNENIADINEYLPIVRE